MTPKERFKIIPASYLVLLKDNKVLMLRRFNTGYEDGNYSLVAGHVDAGETFIGAMVREATEEAGVVLDPTNLSVAHLMQRHALPNPPELTDRIEAFIVAEKWEGEPKNLEPTKCDDLSWFDLDNIPSNTIPYIKYALENIKNNIFYSEFGYRAKA